MSSARDEVFAGVRRSLGVNGRERPRRSLVEDRLARAPAGPIPARAQKPLAERLEIFREGAERAHATFARVASSADAPAEAARFLRDNNLPATLRMGADARLVAMPWGATSLQIAVGASRGDDLNAMSHAFAAVAETGTLVLLSGPENPTTLNFLPDNHLVVIRASDVADSFESVWSSLRHGYGKAVMPRALNMVTGPSSSADIEQTMLLGAHGPRRLHVILIERD